MELCMANNPAKGAYALVFIDKDQGCVLKLFKTAAWDNTVSDADRKHTFDYELEAYQIAEGDETLRNYIPHFHGQVQITKVIDRDGGDISHQFLLDCCYKLDLIEAPEHKILHHYGQLAHVEQMVKEFHARGICYLEDASIFFPLDPVKMKVIDIAVRNLEGWSII